MSYSSTILAETGLQGFWKMGDASGTTCTDATGTQNGTYNSLTLAQTGIPGAGGETSTKFNAPGTNGFVSINGNASQEDSDSHGSVEFWIKLVTASRAFGIVGPQAGAGKQLGVNINSSGVIQFTLQQGGTVLATSSVAITDTTTWHHVVCTKSGSTSKVYVDGVDVTTAGSNDTIITVSEARYVGYQGANFASMYLQYYAIYNAVLTPTQVTNHYALGAQFPVNTVAPAISGSSTVGSTLTCSTGTWTSTGSPTYTYQWWQGTRATPIGGATSSTYVTQVGDVGLDIGCTVTDTDSNGATACDSSNVVTVTSNAPANTVAPVVSGTSNVGSVLTSTAGTWTDDGAGAITYQWQRDTAGSNPYSNIVGQTGTTYTLATADDGCHVRCRVTDTDSHGATTVSSNVKTIVEPVPTNSVVPGVSGAPYFGHTLTGTSGTWTHMDGTVATYAYQWQDSANGLSGWANISGQTSTTYVVTGAESTKYLRFSVTATNTGGPGTAATSSVLGPVNSGPIVASMAAATTAYRARASTPFGFLCEGDSVTEGTGATIPTPAGTKRWVDVCRVALQTHNLGGIVGGLGGIGSSNQNIPSSLWTFGGGYNGQNVQSRWPGQRGAGFTASGTATIVSPPGTSIDVWYWQGDPAALPFTVTINGSATTVTPSTVGGFINNGVTRITTGMTTGGNNTIVLTANAGGTTYCDGITHYNGDENAGTRMYEGGHWGWASASYLSDMSGNNDNNHYATRVPQLNPKLFIIFLGLNDYEGQVAIATFKSNIQAMIALNKTWIPGASHLLVGPYVRTDVISPTIPMTSYAGALSDIAVADSTNIAFLDLSPIFGNPPTAGLLQADGVHPTDTGHALIGNSIATFLVNTFGASTATSTNGGVGFIALGGNLPRLLGW